MSPNAFPDLQSNFEHAMAFLTLATEQLRQMDPEAASFISSHYLEPTVQIFSEVIARSDHEQKTPEAYDVHRSCSIASLRLKDATLSNLPPAPPRLGFGVFAEASSYDCDDAPASDSPPSSTATTVISKLNGDHRAVRQSSWSSSPFTTRHASIDRPSPHQYTRLSSLEAILEPESPNGMRFSASEDDLLSSSPLRKTSGASFGAIGEGRPRKERDAGEPGRHSSTIAGILSSSHSGKERGQQARSCASYGDGEIIEITVGLRGTEAELSPVKDLFERGLVSWSKLGLDQNGHARIQTPNGNEAATVNGSTSGSVYPEIAHAAPMLRDGHVANALVSENAAVTVTGQQHVAVQSSWAAVAATPMTLCIPAPTRAPTQPAQAFRSASQTSTLTPTEPVADQARVVWVTSLPENTTITQVSTQITVGPIMSILLTHDVSATLPGLCACIIFEAAQAASTFLATNSEAHHAGNVFAHLSPNIKILLGSPYPADADILSMRQSPLGTQARRRIKFSRARLFAPHGIPLSEFRNDVLRLVGRANVDFVHFYNPGDATVVFASVRVARYALAAFRAWANGKSAKAPPGGSAAKDGGERALIAKYEGVRVDFARDFNEAPPEGGRLWTQYDGESGRICGVSRAVEIGRVGEESFVEAKGSARNTVWRRGVQTVRRKS